MSEENRFRYRNLNVRITDEEYLTICDKAFSCDLTVSDAVRYLIVFGSIKKQGLNQRDSEKIDNLNELLKRLIYEINRIGNNINQIAYVGNANQGLDIKMIEDAFAEVTNTENYLYETVLELEEKILANSSYS